MKKLKTIAFYPDLARELGSMEAAIYYQQLNYWSDKGKRKDGFIYKTKTEIEEETTLTRFQQDKIRVMLIEKGWLETKLIKANNYPTIHYKTIVKIEDGIVRNLPLEKQETYHPFSKKLTNLITESTAEITTENTPPSTVEASPLMSRINYSNEQVYERPEREGGFKDLFDGY